MKLVATVLMQLVLASVPAQAFLFDTANHAVSGAMNVGNTAVAGAGQVYHTALCWFSLTGDCSLSGGSGGSTAPAPAPAPAPTTKTRPTTTTTTPTTTTTTTTTPPTTTTTTQTTTTTTTQPSGPDIPDYMKPLIEAVHAYYPMDDTKVSGMASKQVADLAPAGSLQAVLGRHDQGVQLGSQGCMKGQQDVHNTCLNDPETCTSGATVAIWVKPGGTTGSDQTVLSTGADCGGVGGGLGLAVCFTASGNLQATVATSGKINMVQLPADKFDNQNKYYHVVVTWSANKELTVYLQGISADSDPEGDVGSARTKSRGFSVGCQLTSSLAGDSLNGAVDELIMWEDALSKDAVYEVFTKVPQNCQDCSKYAVCEPAPVCTCEEGFMGDGYTCDIDPNAVPNVPVEEPKSFWPMDTRGPGDALDGDETVQLRRRMTFVEGLHNKALRFNGRKDFLDVGEYECLSNPGSCKADGFTVNFCLNYQGVRPLKGVLNTIISSGVCPHTQPASTGVSTFAANSEVTFRVATSSRLYEIVTFMGRYQWHCYALTWNQRQGLRLYVDGLMSREDKSGTQGSFSGSTGPTRVGQPACSADLRGRFYMDDLAVWENQVLPDDQILNVFARGPRPGDFV